MNLHQATDFQHWQQTWEHLLKSLLLILPSESETAMITIQSVIKLFMSFNVTESVTSPAFVGVVSTYDLDSIGSQLNYSVLQHPSQPSMFDINSTTVSSHGD